MHMQNEIVDDVLQEKPVIVTHIILFLDIFFHKENTSTHFFQLFF